MAPSFGLELKPWIQKDCRSTIPESDSTAKRGLAAASLPRETCIERPVAGPLMVEEGSRSRLPHDDAHDESMHMANACRRASNGSDKEGHARAETPGKQGPAAWHGCCLFAGYENSSQAGGTTHGDEVLGFSKKVAEP